MAEATETTGVLRPLKIMSSNINGLMADEEMRMKGLRVKRWMHVRSSLERNDVHLLGMQEHHCKTHEEMDSNSRRLRGRKWDYI